MPVCSCSGCAQWPSSPTALRECWGRVCLVEVSATFCSHLDRRSECSVSEWTISFFNLKIVHSFKSYPVYREEADTVDRVRQVRTQGCLDGAVGTALLSQPSVPLHWSPTSPSYKIAFRKLFLTLRCVYSFGSARKIQEVPLSSPTLAELSLEQVNLYKLTHRSGEGRGTSHARTGQRYQWPCSRPGWPWSAR